MKFQFGLAIVLVLFTAGASLADVFVSGHRRKDGTYVKPHYRSRADGNFWNNWSTRGNVNPYTGVVGTRSRPASKASALSRVQRNNPSGRATVIRRPSQPLYVPLPKSAVDERHKNIDDDRAARLYFLEATMREGENRIKQGAQTRRQAFEAQRNYRLRILHLQLESEMRAVAELMAAQTHRAIAEEASLLAKQADQRTETFEASLNAERDRQFESFGNRRGNIESARARIRASYPRHVVAALEARWQRDDARLNATEAVYADRRSRKADSDLAAFQRQARGQAVADLERRRNLFGEQYAAMVAAAQRDLELRVATERDRLEAEFATSEADLIVQQREELAARIQEMRLLLIGEVGQEPSSRRAGSVAAGVLSVFGLAISGWLALRQSC